MALVMPQMLFPIVASLLMEKLLSGKDQSDWKKFIRGLMATAGAIFIAALLVYASSDLSRENKARTNEFNNIYNEAGANLETNMAVLNQSKNRKQITSCMRV